ncbi:MAG: hypothetical protein ACFWUA_05285 [Sporanaerobacter sp.]|jgi:hypothetical protein|uniref:hypothetical protein n=1 Tax=Sporanaerobacter sp. TaxID=2010183 RepID=UPI003A10336B
MNTNQIFIYKPLTDEEIKNFKATPGKFINHFKTLTEKEEYLISSSILDFLYFMNSNLEAFKYYLAMLYKKYNNDTIYEYYLEYVIKSPEIKDIIDNKFEVLADGREYINYYYAERKNEYGDNINHIFAMQKILFNNMDYKIKHYFDRYSFIKEVKAIIKYCSYHYLSIEKIPESHKIRIIRKIETTIFLKNAPESILESFL